MNTDHLIYAPCTTQIPNPLIDYWMSRLSHSELMILMAYFRLRRVSVSKFSKMTGLSQEDVKISLKSLSKLKLMKFQNRAE